MQKKAGTEKGSQRPAAAKIMKHKVKHDVEFEWKNRTAKVHGQPHGQGERDTVSLCNSDI